MKQVVAGFLVAVAMLFAAPVFAEDVTLDGDLCVVASGTQLTGTVAVTGNTTLNAGIVDVGDTVTQTVTVTIDVPADPECLGEAFTYTLVGGTEVLTGPVSLTPATDASGSGVTGTPLVFTITQTITAETPALPGGSYGTWSKLYTITVTKS